MKKVCIYIITLISICFILPAIFTNSSNQTSSNANTNTEISSISNSEQQEAQQEGKSEEQSAEQKSADQAENQNSESNGKYGTIKLLHTATGEVEEVQLETYLCNVVSAEMPATFEKEALKAQAIVARTYTVYKINNKKHDNCDICDSSACCQAWISKEDRLARWEEDKREEYWQKICDAVNETKGKVVTYEGQPINAFFHSNSGGTTEIPINVWGGTDYPYLQVVETAGEEGYTQYASEAEFSNQELIEKLKATYADIQIDFSNDEDIKILEYTESGRVKTVKFGNHNISGVETRSIFGLKSSNFEIEKSDGKIKFSVKGYGHRCWDESDWCR